MSPAKVFYLDSSAFCILMHTSHARRIGRLIKLEDSFSQRDFWPERQREQPAHAPCAWTTGPSRLRRAMSGEWLKVLEPRPSVPTPTLACPALSCSAWTWKAIPFGLIPGKKTPAAADQGHLIPDVNRKREKGKEETPPLLIAFGWNPRCPIHYITPAQRDTCAEAGAGPGTGMPRAWNVGSAAPGQEARGKGTNSGLEGRRLGLGDR